MSIYSDYECGAISDQEFRNACARENRKEIKSMEEYEEDRKAHLKSMICDNFCKFPAMYSMAHGDDKQDRMQNEVCDVCPLNDL